MEGGSAEEDPGETFADWPAALEAFSSPLPPGLDVDASPGLGGVSCWPEQSAVANANFAAQQVAQLSQYVAYLQMTVFSLRDKVSELEQWKKTTLEDVRKLREDHKELRRKLACSEARDDVLMEQTPACSSASLPHGLSLNSLSGFGLDAGGGVVEGITVAEGQVDGAHCMRAEWRIGNLSTKLRGCKGRALVSSPFSAAGLRDLRLMVCPDVKDATGSDRSSRLQKEFYLKKVTEGPLDAALRLKASGASATDGPEEIRYFLKVGSKRMGPFRHNFRESTLSGCDAFDVDWLRHLDHDLSLLVCLEILTSCSGGGGGGGEPLAANPSHT